jgi:predicted permease
VRAFAECSELRPVAGVFPRPKAVITRELVQQLASILLHLFIPCLLIGALGKSLDGGTLLASAGLIVWAAIHLVVSFLIAKFVMLRLVSVPPALQLPVLLAMAFNNSGSLPVVLLQPLTASSVFAHDDTAYKRGILYTWVYNLVWQLALWGVGYRAIYRQAMQERGELSDAETPHSGRCNCESLWDAMKRVVGSPPVVGMAIGTLIGLIPALSGAFFHPGGVMYPVGAVIQTLGEAMVPSSNIVLAGSLFYGTMDAVKRLWPRSRGSELELTPVAPAAEAKSIVRSLSSEEEEDQADGRVVTHLSAEEEGRPTEYQSGLSLQAILLMTLFRLVIIPGVLFGLYCLALEWKIPLLVPPSAEADSMIWVVALLEAAMPSAQFSLILVQQVGLTHAAEALSLVFLVMYPLAMVTIPGWLVWAMHLVLGSSS